MQRALLHIKRKKAKTLIVFLLVWLIASFVLVSMNIIGATETASTSLRESIGASFRIKGNFTMEDDNVSSISVPRSVIDTAMEVDGILFYNAASSMALTDIDIMAMPGIDYEVAVYKGRVSANHYSAANSYFSDNEFSLCEGRHVQPDDRNVVIINNELAELNGLSIGDSISFTSESGSATVVIIGIFQLENYDEASMATAELPQNLFFTDYLAYEELGGASDEYSNGVSFFVRDPEELDAIVTEVKAITTDREKYIFSTDDAGYQKSATQLNEIKQFISILFLAVCIVSVVVLMLVFSLQIRNRINEAGVFMSLGIRKRAIIGQFLSEILIISLIAFSLSFLTGMVVSEKIEDGLLSDLSQAQSLEIAGINNTGQNSEDAPGITIGKILLIYVTELGVIGLTVFVASYSILRLKPKEILSKMS